MRTSVVALLVLIATGCSPPTEVVVYLEADDDVRDAAVRAQVAWGPLEGDLERRDRGIGSGGEAAWPITMPLSPGEGFDPAGEFRVEARAYDANGRTIAIVTARSRFVPNERRELRLRFDVDCMDPVSTTQCFLFQSCRAGSCGEGCFEATRPGEVDRSEPMSCGITTPGDMITVSPRARYRSVGYGSTEPLDEGGATDVLQIRDSIASFTTARAGNIGVGDALQYDADDDGEVDTLAFIHERFGPDRYYVVSADGLPAPNTTSMAEEEWKLCRAYTSMQAAENGEENTDCLTGDPDFDRGNEDVVASDELFHFALYADAPHANNCEVDGWKTDEDHYVTFFVPRDPNQVGVSQRHDGVWDDSRFRMTRGSSWQVGIRIGQYVRVEGLQAENNHGGNGMPTLVVLDLSRDAAPVPEDRGRVLIDGNIVRLLGSGGNPQGITCRPDTRCVVTNNVVYDFNALFEGRETGVGIANGPSAEAYVYDNTIVNCFNGIDSGGTTDRIFNNLVQGTQNAAYEVSPDAATGANVADDGTSPDGDEFNDQSVSFEALAADDFRLAPDDLAARGRGVDPSDERFAPTSDILGHPRTDPWDIGAFEMDP